MTRFLLIRHGVTDAIGKHLSGRMAGVHLNAAGKEQARQLAERLKGYPIAAIYSSPLERTMETAAPIAEALGLTIKTSDYFLEINFGEWTSRSFAALQQEASFHQFNSFRSGTRVPGGESMMEAQLRMVNGMEELKKTHDGQTIAIVGHSDLIKAAIAYYAAIPLDLFQRLEISPASLSIIDLFAETARIFSVNDTGALPD